MCVNRMVINLVLECYFSMNLEEEIYDGLLVSSQNNIENFNF